MRQLLKITFIILATTVAFTACRGNEEDIIPSGNYSPIRGGFPQDSTALDTLIYEIKQEYGVYLLYKDVTEEDMNRDWISAGTGDIYVAGYEEDRDLGAWDLPKEHLPYYVNFFRYDIFPNISKEFARSTFPVKIYMIHNLRTEPRDFGEDSGVVSGTDLNPYKTIKLGNFDNWAISFPDSVIFGTTSNASYSLKQQRCVFMINVINNSVEKGELVSPDEFWNDYDMRDSVKVNVKDMDAANSLYNLGFVDMLEEKFGTGRSPEVVKPLPVLSKTELETSYWRKGNNFDLFKAYMMNAMWFTPEEFHARYNTEKFTKIKEKYEFVVDYIKDEYGLDLVGIAYGKRNEDTDEKL